MHVILSILLYLQVIVSPGTYTVSEINLAVERNQVQVNKIQNNPDQLTRIMELFQGEVSGITVIDDGQLK